MAGDNREDERVVILGALQGAIMVFQPVLVREVSPSGVSIETRFPLQIDSLHDLRLSIGERSLVIKARVVHSRLSDVDQDTVMYRTGLEFIEPSVQAVAAIAEFVETLKENRSGV